MKLELDDKWKWAAKDEDKRWFVFGGRPKKEVSKWGMYGREFMQISGIVGDLPDCPWQDSLHQIINGELVKYVELKVDDKVMVRNCGGDWHKRYYSHTKATGGICCFGDGATSWSRGKTAPMTWLEWRLPTPEELA